GRTEKHRWRDQSSMVSLSAPARTTSGWHMPAGRGVHIGRLRLWSRAERDRAGRLQLRRVSEGGQVSGGAALASHLARNPQAAGTVENRGGRSECAPAAANAGDRLSRATRTTTLTCARNDRRFAAYARQCSAPARRVAMTHSSPARADSPLASQSFSCASAL